MKLPNPDGAVSAPKPFVTEEAFSALLNEVFERLGIAEGRIDDLERSRDGQNRKIALLEQRLAAFEAAS